MWNSTFEQGLWYWLTKDWSGLQKIVSIKVAELLCFQLLGLSKVGVLKMTAFFRDRRSSWLACVALAFPCGPVWFRSKERGRRVKDRAKNRASNCFETTQKRLLRRLLVAERRLFREYQNHPFLGTWFRFWLQFFRSSHQDNFENCWQVVLPV